MHTSNTDHDETLKDFRIAINQLVDDDNMPEVLALIEKDRERVVREARVDELKSIALVCRDLEDGEDPNDAVAIEVEHRIADLQSTIKTNQSI